MPPEPKMDEQRGEKQQASQHRPPDNPLHGLVDSSVPRNFKTAPIQHIRIAVGRIDDVREAERCAALACS
jgi:hypothetical protein